MINFTAWPEMLAWPYLILQGWLPYRDIAIAHNPLLLLDLVVFFKIFGVGMVQLKIYTWILITINTYLVYFVSNKFWNRNSAYLSAMFYILLTIVFEGNGLWFDIALTPFALLLYLFLREKKYIWAGVVFSLGFLTKQTFIYFAILVLILMFKDIRLKIKEFTKFTIGSGTILIIFLVCLNLLGILDDYYNWAIKFGIFYLPQAVGQVSLPNLKQFLFAVFPFLLAILSTEYIVLGFAVIGALGSYPRWELFHFQPALPFIAIALSTIIYSKRNNILKIMIVGCIMLYVVYGVSRQIGNTTRFFESDVKEVVSTHTALNLKSNNLYVINYWDNIYALTNTIPATKPLIPYIPWYLNFGDNKTEILNDLKIEMPDEIVIGERDVVFPEIYTFVDKFYTCNVVEKKVELCEKN